MRDTKGHALAKEKIRASVVGLCDGMCGGSDWDDSGAGIQN